MGESKRNSGWAKCKVGDVFQAVSGNSNLIKGKLSSTPGEGLFPAFSASGQDVWCAHAEHDGEAIIVSAVGARCGKAFQAQGKWCAIANTHILFPVAGAIDTKFSWYLLNDENFWVRGGTAQPFVKVRASLEKPLALPPIAEQRRIVAKIEELFSELDKGIENLQSARAQLKTYRQSLLKAAFEGRLTEQWRRENADKLEPADQLLARIRKQREARYQQQLVDWKAEVEQWESEGKPRKKPRRPKSPCLVEAVPANELSGVPELPGSSTWIRLGSLVEIISGGTPKGITAVRGSGIPYFKVGDMNTPGNDPVMQHSRVELSEEEARELGLHVLPEESIIFPKRGGAIATNKKRRIGRRACIDLNTMAITGFPPSINPAFMWYWFVALDLSQISDGSNVPQINNRNIVPLAFPIFPKEEQEIIVGLLEASLSQVENMERAITTTLQQAETLRQSILKRAFEGKLVPQDPNDEPAAELLARIRTERQSQKPKRTKKKRRQNA